jgi:O-antigen biosynthesis protein
MKTLRLVLATAILVAISSSGHAYGHSIEVRGKGLYVDGKQFTVKGMHYGPWRPGTGPAKGYPYPGPEAIEQDLRLIRSLNVNTIFVNDPPGYVLDLADKYGLKVLYSFYVNWWTIGSPKGKAERDSVLQRVEQYREKPALLGWVLGNEISLNVIEQRGDKTLENGLAELYLAVKAVDSQHPITHSNWSVAKDLNLNFFDIVGFNVYPLWPPEVVALGFDHYIEQVLQPIAANKPLLITEFGVNSLEAKEDGEARLLSQSWSGLQKAGACGGIVFEFADEWWKNYDNPRRAGDWWDRKPAPDDEKTHDLDPEEYYGVVQADRQPKAAFKVVQEMFASDEHRLASAGRLIPALMISLLLLLAGGAWLWAVRRRRGALRGQQGEV